MQISFIAVCDSNSEMDGNDNSLGTHNISMTDLDISQESGE